MAAAPSLINPTVDRLSGWVFTGLVVAMVVGNQEWRLFGLLWGQIISWFVDIAAVAIVVIVFRGQAWPYLLLTGIIVTRLLGSGFRGSGAIDLVYLALLNALFVAAGVAVVGRYSERVRHHLNIICLTSTLLMVMQTTGVGEWTQVLATENEGRPKTAYPTLFVQQRDLQYQTIQARPSGWLHSNNFLSLVVMFALALQFGDKQRRKLDKWDWVLAVMVVLAMAKIVWASMLVMMAYLVLFGTRHQRRRMLRLAVVLVGLMVLYRAIFPGLFHFSTGSGQLAYSFFIRVNDFVERLDPYHPVVRFLYPYLYDTPRHLGRDNVTGFTGYTQVLPWLPHLAAAGVIVFPLYLRGMKRLRERESDVGPTSMLVAVAVVTYPAAVPMFAAPIYWFIAGFAVLPLVAGVMPSSLRRLGPASEPDGSDDERAPELEPLAAQGPQ